MGSAFAGTNAMVDCDAKFAIEHPAVAAARIARVKRGENVMNFPTNPHVLQWRRDKRPLGNSNWH